MSVVLLDTTVASLLHPKKQNDTRRAGYEPHMQGQILALSFQSVASCGNGRKKITGAVMKSSGWKLLFNSF